MSAKSWISVLSSVLLSACAFPSGPRVCAGLGTPIMVVHATSSTTGDTLDARATIKVILLSTPPDSEVGQLSNNPPSLAFVRFSGSTARADVFVSVPGFAPGERVVQLVVDQCGNSIPIAVTMALTPLTP